ncbi:helix-turn-helix domain-containing protein [Flavobacterium sp. '19STA2R22 D10 B1']|uniref:helix-turn-helix domain-containing protein n=1 Tax=Flavobacterium aerium TaxID=3037261 RepID=UPI00278C4C31|nr:helix-turn-helix transcriptional regulator [Flavobacterium sp. '19STA2R22 D10 B1']
MHLNKGKIRLMRKKNNISQEQMAELLNLSQSQYSRIENGKSIIDLKKVRKIADVLKTNPLSILYVEKRKSLPYSPRISSHIHSERNNDFSTEINLLKKEIQYLKKENNVLKKLSLMTLKNKM